VDQGTIRLVYKHLPVIDKVRSAWAAEATECAGDQGKFWAYHDKLYTNPISSPTKENLKSYAKGLGLDTSAFNQCLDSGKYSDLIKQYAKEATDLKVTGTPTFLVNGKQVAIRDFSDVILAINAEVTK
jgi:protein-disulfide isomerase